jgi:hypothetical protein
MPIKDWSKYPKDWKQIRQRILEREGHKCKICGVENYNIGYRDENSVWHPIEQSCQGDVDAEDVKREGYKIIKIVLTIAHLNHDTTDNRDENLAALCQLHHIRHDINHHKASSSETRRMKKRLQSLF